MAEAVADGGMGRRHGAERRSDDLGSAEVAGVLLPCNRRCVPYERFHLIGEPRSGTLLESTDQRGRGRVREREAGDHDSQLGRGGEQGSPEAGSRHACDRTGKGEKGE